MKYSKNHIKYCNFQVHRRECRLLQEENNLALALAATDQRFVEASDARALRTIFSKSQETTPLIFVLTELKSFLKSSMLHWDPEVYKWKIGFSHFRIENT